MLPLAAVERIARKAGVERISHEAVEELTKIVEEIAEEVVIEVVTFTEHAKRKTIKAKDVKLVAGKV